MFHSASPVRLYLLIVHAAAVVSAIGLWPIPRQLSVGSAPLKLGRNFSIVISHSSIPSPPSDLLAAIARSSARLASNRFQRLVVGRAAADATAIKGAHEVASLVLSLANAHAGPNGEGAHVPGIAEETRRPIEEWDEAYILSVPAQGGGSRGIEATLAASSTLGLLRGLATFEQLWYDADGTKYLLEGGVEIHDAPAFPYRGFSFDTSRNFYPVSDILRMLDAMSWVKMSVLYWHVIDSQSFPLDVPGMPELAAHGAYSESEIYTQADVRNITQFANERGINVVMELDSPGHTTAIGASHPALVACPNASPWSRYAQEPPSGQLRIASPTTLAFAQNLFRNMARALPGTMMSSGGDEVNLPCWADDAETQRDLAARNITIDEALNEYVGAVQGVMHEEGKVPFIKSDMVLTHNVPVLNNTVVVVWQTSADAAAVAQRGMRFIHQPSNYFYLDCGAGDWLGNNIAGNSWCDPFKTWQRAYSFDPYANLTTDQYHLVLGGQMPIWSEQSSPENLDPIVWPRLAVAAEVFWTGATLPDGKPRLGANETSGTRALGRLNELRYRLVDRGVQAIALQPKWCALRPGECEA